MTWLEVEQDTLNALKTGGGVFVCTFTGNGNDMITHFAGHNTPQSMADMALVLLRQAKDDLIERDKKTPLDEDDEAFLTALTDIINDLTSDLNPEASA